MLFFDEAKPFFKGNLHCHSTNSDGVKMPEEVIDTYRELGYDFLTITDHRTVTTQRSHMAGGMLVMPGVELDYCLVEEVVHIVGVGMVQDPTSLINYEDGPRGGIEAINRCGGRAIVAHPHWSLNTLATLTALHGTVAAEVFNTTSYLRQDSANILDLTAAHGRLYPFVASDDSHEYNGEPGGGFTMVQADSLTPEAILTAMDQGRFYASQGPRIEQLNVENGVFSVRCSPASRIYFYSNLAWAPGQLVRGDGLTTAHYGLNPHLGERFVRCQVIDALGKSAWCSPIAL
jgi:hypothetical protein